MALLLLPTMEGKDYVSILLFVALLGLALRTFYKEWVDRGDAKKRLQKQDVADQIEAGTSGAHIAVANLEINNRAQAARILLLDRENAECKAENEELTRANKKLEERILEGSQEWFGMRGAFDQIKQRLEALEGKDDIHTSQRPRPKR